MSHECNPTTIIQKVMRHHAIAYQNMLSLSRLDDVALQFGKCLLIDDAHESFTFGRTLFIYGINLTTITATMIEIQSVYLNHHEHQRVIRSGCCCSTIIEGFVYEQLLHVYAAQEREIRSQLPPIHIYNH